MSDRLGGRTLWAVESVRAAQNSGVQVAAIRGVVLNADVPALARWLLSAVAAEADRVVLDCTGVEYLTSEAAWVFLRLQRHCRNRDVGFVIAGGSAVHKVIDRLGLWNAFPLYGELDDAVGRVHR